MVARIAWRSVPKRSPTRHNGSSASGHAGSASSTSSASTSRSKRTEDDRAPGLCGAHRADLRRARGGRVRRLDQRRGDAPLVPRRPGLGDAGGGGGSPDRREGGGRGAGNGWVGGVSRGGGHAD